MSDSLGILGVRAWTSGVEVEQEARAQLEKVASLPILAGHLAVMPDVHWGQGATVGSVIPTHAAVIPSAVGVDIGCGMCAVKTDLVASDLPDSLHALRLSIEAAVPVGFNQHEEPLRFTPSTDPALGVALTERTKELAKRFVDLRIMERIGTEHNSKVFRQLGTLGGGNHFIEICLDTKQNVWVMLHSGSRGIGNKIGSYAIQMAKEIAEKADRQLPDRNLAWLNEGTPEFEMYVEGMHWAQDYAAHSRDMMLYLVLKTLNAQFGREVAVFESAINCHHNYTSVEEHFGQRMWVTRKGAVSAQMGQLGIIPGSMGAKSFIVRGKGNEESYCSCSHGAGRRMSRSAAKKQFTAADVRAQTEGVECKKDSSVVDEIPGAYKSIEAVMNAQADLVEPIHELKQILCIKG